DLLRLGRAAPEDIDLGGAIVCPIHLDQNAAVSRAEAPPFPAMAHPFDVNVGSLESEGGEAAHRLDATPGQNERVWLRCLENAPHPLDIFAGVAPVALGVEISQG